MYWTWSVYTRAYVSKCMHNKAVLIVFCVRYFIEYIMFLLAICLQTSFSTAATFSSCLLFFPILSDASPPVTASGEDLDISGDGAPPSCSVSLGAVLTAIQSMNASMQVMHNTVWLHV